ncbi:MAG: PD-(D/E)XK nuclease family protein [Sulfurihydrogenibium sp.]|jgi:CRISPR/Cas system-associated exonuclease Cas4 (RecB family)|nr:PD-(D/E)XK nuclease family protein [Sulfurihydrogenibium sp.]
MLEISPSGINLFLTCPYAFRLKYIDKLEITQQENNFLITGKLTHKCLELYFKDKMENKNNDLKPVDYMKIAVEDFNHINVFQLDEAIEEAEHYLTLYTPTAKQLKPLSSEEYFELELTDNLLLRGVIDLIVQEKKGRALIDFKTTRGQVKDNYKYTLQLSFYSLTNKADAYYLHYITPTHIQVKEIKPVDKSLLNDIVKDIEKAVKFGVYPASGLGVACNSCPYKKYCKYSDIK